MTISKLNNNDTESPGLPLLLRSSQPLQFHSQHCHSVEVILQQLTIYYLLYYDI